MPTNNYTYTRSHKSNVHRLNELVAILSWAKSILYERGLFKFIFQNEVPSLKLLKKAGGGGLLLGCFFFCCHNMLIIQEKSWAYLSV